MSRAGRLTPPAREREPQPGASPAVASSVVSGPPVPSGQLADVCKTTGKARLSYRRAAELFDYYTRALANPAIVDEQELELRGGWTLH